MTKRIVTFLLAVVWHWGNLLTAGVPIGILSMWQLTGHSVRPWVGWAIGLYAVLVGSFRAWDAQRNATERIANELKQETDKAQNLRRAIYKEMIYLYAQTRSLRNEMPNTDQGVATTAKILKVLRTDSYDLAKSQADVFYKLPEAYKIDSVYGFLGVIHIEGIQPQGIRDILSTLIDKLERAFEDPVFDRQLFDAIGKEAKWVYAPQAQSAEPKR